MILQLLVAKIAWDVSVEQISAGVAHPPVLVPPIRSKTSHGRGTTLRPRAARSFSITSSRMSRLESPRMPPPSKDT
jgi:hypothetical protein